MPWIFLITSYFGVVDRYLFGETVGTTFGIGNNLIGTAVRTIGVL